MIRMVGNWSDSYPYYEAIEYFQYIYPREIPKIEYILSGKENSTRNQILRELDGKIPKNVLGLLNLSLSLRYFQPKAALTHPKPNKNPKIRGWYATSTSSLPSIYTNDYQWKMLTQMHNTQGTNEKLKFIADSTLYPKDNMLNISKYHVNNNIIEEYNRLNFQHRSRSIINGRITSAEPLELLEAMIEETQNVFNLIELKLNLSLLHQLQYGNPNRKVFEYVEPIKWSRTLLHHDLQTTRQKWDEDLKINATYPADFLKVAPEMLTIQIFINLTSPESPAILETILDLTKTDHPYGFQVIVVPDFDNITEVMIAYAYHEVLNVAADRGACEFLLDGILHGFKKAYIKARPDTPWKELPSIINTSPINKTIESIKEYVNKTGLNRFAISINGQFIKSYPSFTDIKIAIAEMGYRLMDYAVRGEISNTTNFRKFSKTHGIPMDTIDTNMSIGMKDYISINGLPANSILNIVEFLSNATITYKTWNKTLVNKIPVFFINCDAPDTNFTVPHFYYCNMNSSDFNHQAKRVLRITGSQQTIVGPLIFDRALTKEELRYALYYVFHAHMDNFPHLTIPQMIYVLLWRASDGLKGIKRIEPIKIESGVFIRHNSTSFLEWYLEYDPFLPEFRPIIELLTHAAELDVVQYSFVPLVSKGQWDVPSHFYRTYYSNYFESGITTQTNDIVLHYPSNWVVEKDKENGNYVLTSVATYGIAKNRSIIQIGDQQRSPLDSGYFVFFAPPGIYQTKGLVERTLISDSLLPSPHLVRQNGDIVETSPNDGKLNIVTFVLDEGSRKHVQIQLHTLLANASCPVKLWLIDFGNLGRPKSVETTILPAFWPHFVEKPNGRLMFVRSFKFVTLDLLLPPNTQNIMVTDMGTIFRGDACRFNKLDMKSAVVAAPLKSSKTKASNTLYWNSAEFQAMRFKRPFHSNTLIWLNMPKWRQIRAGDLYRNLYNSYRRYKLFRNAIDEDLFNIMQLKVQVMTLPENIQYCSIYSDQKYEASAFSIGFCDSNSIDFMRKEYEEMLQQVQLEY